MDPGERMVSLPRLADGWIRLVRTQQQHVGVGLYGLDLARDVKVLHPQNRQ